MYPGWAAECGCGSGLGLGLAGPGGASLSGLNSTKPNRPDAGRLGSTVAGGAAAAV